MVLSYLLRVRVSWVSNSNGVNSNSCCFVCYGVARHVSNSNGVNSNIPYLYIFAHFCIVSNSNGVNSNSSCSSSHLY